MRVLILILAGVGLTMAAERAERKGPAPKKGAVVAAAPEFSGEGDGIRDVLLMLDESPLHLRFHITLSGSSLLAARSAYVDRLMKSLDSDGDGKLSPEEADRSPLLTTKRRGKAAAFLDTLESKRSVTRDDIMKSVERVGRETVAYRQDASASGNDSEVFKLLDADASGFIDKNEMAQAAARILERDMDQDECISFQEFLPEPDPNQQPALVLQRPGRPPAPTTTLELVHDISEPTLPLRLVKKYDKNRDGKLTAEELGWEAERVKMLDRNADGKLSREELAAIARTAVDLELAVDLAGPPEGETALKILAMTGKRVDDARRPDIVRLVFSKAVLTLSFRKIDPMKTAIEKAMQAFNQLDVDGNGYLDDKETALGVRFQTGLFDSLDADGDGKIFGEEMEKYVSVRGEPAATSARVHVYDIGHGFFEALDTNGDGRISMREMKFAGKSLQNMAPENEKLSPRDPARNFHIEFTRGSFVLFGGPADQVVAQTTPSFEQRVPIGPIWFQRMDRNNDGDLTWNEFLGPREVFHRIDRDGDGLIDPQEAEAFRED